MTPRRLLAIRVVLVALGAVTPASAIAQALPPLPIQDGQVIPLWTGAAPGALGTDDTDIPVITVYLPRTVAANTPAMIVCPGGGYRALGVESRRAPGRQLSQLARRCGVRAALSARPALSPSDRAGRCAARDPSACDRTPADWRIDPSRIGIIGFSAGGHLAMTASTRFDAGRAGAADAVDRVSSRPDFAVLGYPVISMTEEWTHKGSRTNLLGDNPDPELAKSLSGERAVTRDTPPTFLFQTNEDAAVPAENAVHYYLALRKAGVPAEMHVFEKGPHGVGLANDDPALSAWSKLLANWLRVRKLIK